MKTFGTWREARTYAQQIANETKLSLGIEKSGYPGYPVEWVVRYLPKKENRYGYDTQCEAVEPE